MTDNCTATGERVAGVEEEVYVKPVGFFGGVANGDSEERAGRRMETMMKQQSGEEDNK